MDVSQRQLFAQVVGDRIVSRELSESSYGALRLGFLHTTLLQRQQQQQQDQALHSAPLTTSLSPPTSPTARSSCPWCQVLKAPRAPSRCIPRPRRFGGRGSKSCIDWWRSALRVEAFRVKTILAVLLVLKATGRWFTAKPACFPIANCYYCLLTVLLQTVRMQLCLSICTFWGKVESGATEM